jgi:hypothetical protein
MTIQILFEEGQKLFTTVCRVEMAPLLPPSVFDRVGAIDVETVEQILGFVCNTLAHLPLPESMRKLKFLYFGQSVHVGRFCIRMVVAWGKYKLNHTYKFSSRLLIYTCTSIISQCI